MGMTRSLKQWLCRLMAGVMLFAQMSIAAYACPGLATSLLEPSSAVASPMANCDQMMAHADKAFPNLCAAHCHQGQQSDQTQVPTLPAMMLISLYTVNPTVPALAPGWPTRAEQIALSAAPPPLSILHCCFRI
jgi:hypothetical protein